MNPINSLVNDIMDSGTFEAEGAGADKLKQLGFCEALLDSKTFAIYTLGPESHLIHVAGFVQGFERNGFFYTRSAAAQAAAEWA